MLSYKWHKAYTPQYTTGKRQRERDKMYSKLWFSFVKSHSSMEMNFYFFYFEGIQFGGFYCGMVVSVCAFMPNVKCHMWSMWCVKIIILFLIWPNRKPVLACDFQHNKFTLEFRKSASMENVAKLSIELNLFFKTLCRQTQLRFTQTIDKWKQCAFVW